MFSAAFFTSVLFASAISAAPSYDRHRDSYKPPADCESSSKVASATTSAPPQETSAVSQMMVSANQSAVCGSGATSAVYCELVRFCPFDEQLLIFSKL